MKKFKHLKESIYLISRPMKGYKDKHHYGVWDLINNVVYHSHTDDKNKNNATFQKTSLSVFLQGNFIIRVHDIDRKTKFDHETIINNCKDKCGKHEPYWLPSDNCEHFARYCYCGTKTSRQIIAGSIIVLGSFWFGLYCNDFKKGLLAGLFGGTVGWAFMNPNGDGKDYDLEKEEFIED